MESLEPDQSGFPEGRWLLVLAALVIARLSNPVGSGYASRSYWLGAVTSVAAAAVLGHIVVLSVRRRIRAQGVSLLQDFKRSGLVAKAVVLVIGIQCLLGIWILSGLLFQTDSLIDSVLVTLVALASASLLYATVAGIAVWLRLLGRTRSVRPARLAVLACGFWLTTDRDRLPEGGEELLAQARGGVLLAVGSVVALGILVGVWNMVH